MASILCTSVMQLNKAARCIQQERVVPGFDNSQVFLRGKVRELALRHERLALNNHELDLTNTQFGSRFLGQDLVAAAYDQCRGLYVKENDHFNFGTSLMNPQKQKAIWAIWAWGRRIDETVDGLNGSFATHDAFDRLKERMINIYQGLPFDIYDVALADTLTRYQVDFQLFKDLIDGTRLDLTSMKFKNFDEHYLYRYYVAASFFLVLFQVMGIAPESKAKIETVYDGMLTLGNALALIDSLRDVGEDAKAGRIYLSQDELKHAGLSEEDIFSGIVTNKWRNLMKQQVKRARILLDQGAEYINELNTDVRWSLWATVLAYRQDLEVIEARDYDVFTRKATSGIARRLSTLPVAYAKSLGY